MSLIAESGPLWWIEQLHFLSIRRSSGRTPQSERASCRRQLNEREARRACRAQSRLTISRLVPEAARRSELTGGHRQERSSRDCFRRLSRPARNAEDRDERECGVRGHHQEERAVAAEQIEQRAVHRVTDAAAERHAQQEQ